MFPSEMSVGEDEVIEVRRHGKKMSYQDTGDVRLMKKNGEIVGAGYAVWEWSADPCAF